MDNIVPEGNGVAANTSAQIGVTAEAVTDQISVVPSRP